MRLSLPSSRGAPFARVALAALLLAGAAHPARGQPPPAAPADLMLVNGRILTIDATDRVAQAVAIRGNRIIAVGSSAEVERTAGPATRRIDLRGRAVTPGLLDAHAHFSDGYAERLDLSYPAVKSIADLTAKVAARAAQVGAGRWVEGHGWDEGKLAERRLVTARDLDAVSAANPVYLTQTMGHYGVANSVALRLAGITRDTPDPPNGTIDRHPDGTPTGILKESAQGLVRRHIPPRTAADVERSIVWDTNDWKTNPPLAVRYAPWIRAEAARGLQLLTASDPDALRRRGLAAVTLGVGLATADLVLLKHARGTGGQGLMDALLLGRHGAFAEPQIVERVAPQAVALWDADLSPQALKVVQELLSLLAPFETTKEGALATLLLQGARATDLRNSPERRARMISAVITTASRSIQRLPFESWAPLVNRLATRGLSDAERCAVCVSIAQELRETVLSLGRHEVPASWGVPIDFQEGSSIESSKKAPAAPRQRKRVRPAAAGRNRPLAPTDLALLKKEEGK